MNGCLECFATDDVYNQTRRMCNPCYQAWRKRVGENLKGQGYSRSLGQQPPAVVNHRRRLQYSVDPLLRARAQQNAARRRAKKLGQFVEDVTLSYLMYRDKYTCQLCGKKVRSIARRKRDPEYGSIDHLIPSSLGGDHSRANTQLAHLRCNESKGNRGGHDEQLRLATDKKAVLFE